MSIDLDGTIKTINFKAKGDDKDVVAAVTIECQPNELESGRLSRLAGKDVEFTVSSRQIELPLKQEQPAHVVTDID